MAQEKEKKFGLNTVLSVATGEESLATRSLSGATS